MSVARESVKFHRCDSKQWNVQADGKTAPGNVMPKVCSVCNVSSYGGRNQSSPELLTLTGQCGDSNWLGVDTARHPADLSLRKCRVVQKPAYKNSNFLTTKNKNKSLPVKGWCWSRERETDRQTDRQTDRDRERERQRQRDREIETETERHRESSVSNWASQFCWNQGKRLSLIHIWRCRRGP